MTIFGFFELGYTFGVNFADSCVTNVNLDVTLLGMAESGTSTIIRFFVPKKLKNKSNGIYSDRQLSCS